MRLLPAPLALHDVRDVETFARSIMERRLKAWNARLSPTEAEALLSFLITTAWELSGLQGDGRTPRRVWYVTGEVVAPAAPQHDWTDGAGWTWVDVEHVTVERLGPFPSEVAARAAAVVDMRDPMVFDAPPPGAFDPKLNTSFSKYAFNILGLRIVDWYRERFHDARYGEQHDEVSLDQLAAELDCSVDELVEARPDTDLEGAMLRVAILRR